MPHHTHPRPARLLAACNPSGQDVRRAGSEALKPCVSFLGPAWARLLQRLELSNNPPIPCAIRNCLREHWVTTRCRPCPAPVVELTGPSCLTRGLRAGGRCPLDRVLLRLLIGSQVAKPSGATVSHSPGGGHGCTAPRSRKPGSQSAPMILPFCTRCIASVPSSGRSAVATGFASLASLLGSNLGLDSGLARRSARAAARALTARSKLAISEKQGLGSQASLCSPEQPSSPTSLLLRARSQPGLAGPCP